ncbi:hypothetical protein EDD18DRAFT_530548 [Armillaria luteobubalina]|uniref:Nucleotidyltransferase family protein n=1 Tax=Armillaria luteobubalina TaxID=153913 RepID=A0AA39PWP7_9AGAR|nr:hypothetical protein EDD18DRAFT_530548 [Armillaria luteobubalina]
MLTSPNSRGLPKETKTYKNVVSALQLLSQHNVDVRAAFEDVAELDQLVCTYVKAHQALRPYSIAVGFDSVLPLIPWAGPSEVNVRTVCGPTPTVRIPAIGEKGSIVFQGALDATRVLQDSGYSCAIFGSAACYPYGNKRHPKDVDILVSSSADAEVVKARMVKRLPVHFSLVKAQTPGATYKILWYRYHHITGGRIVSRQTKVDIVMAGAMMLPFLSSKSAVTKESLPVVPLEVLLLHKLQGWHAHLTAPEPYKQRKQTADVVDIRRILKIVLQCLTGTERSWARVALSFFQDAFQHLTMDRVKLFCSAFPDCRDDWYQLGFEVI